MQNGISVPFFNLEGLTALWGGGPVFLEYFLCKPTSLPWIWKTNCLKQLRVL